MAEVHRAAMRGPGNFLKYVALKRILPELQRSSEEARRTLDEAKLAAQLDHPNIAQIIDVGEQEGVPYIAIELVDGQSVAALLTHRAQANLEIPMADALLVCEQVLAGLGAAHGRRDSRGRLLGIVHRDVSPQNILIGYSGIAKLIDFGLAAISAGNDARGFAAGKPGYMSPEQLRGEPVDRRADLYAVAVVLFEMLTLTRLFGDEMPANPHVSRAAPPIDRYRPDAPADLVTVLDKALHPEADFRYPDARSFEKALATIRHRIAPGTTSHDLADLMLPTFASEIADEQRIRRDFEAQLTAQAPQGRLSGFFGIFKR